MVLVITSCSDFKATYDYDKEIDFTRYDSFVLLPWTEGDSLINRFDKERIENSVRKEMLDRGHAYQKQGAKLAVTLFMKHDNKTSTTAYSNQYGGYGYGYGYRYPGWGWGGGMSSTTYSDYDYTVGTLIIDVYDTKNKMLIWQGVGSGTVDDNPQTRERKIPFHIAYIFKKYPRKVQKY